MTSVAAIPLTPKQAAFDYSKPQTLVVKVEPTLTKTADGWSYIWRGRRSGIDTIRRAILSDYPDGAERELVPMQTIGNLIETFRLTTSVATVTIHNARVGPNRNQLCLLKDWSDQHDAPYDPDRFVVVLETRPIE